MKLKALKFGLAALVIAGLGSAAAAFATPGKGHNPHGSTITTLSTPTTTSTTPTTTTNGHRPPKTGAGCKPAVALIVKGTTTGDAGSSSLPLNVTGGNHFAKLLFANNTSTALTVNTSTSTKLTTSSGDTTTLSAIGNGSKVLVQYRVCKADLKGATTSTLSSMLSSPTLTPKKIVKLG